MVIFTGCIDMDYITTEDKVRLEKELSDRIGQQKVLSDRIGRARELGDLKENAEYHAAKDDQGMNEARIKLLKERLEGALVTDMEDVPEDMVFVGSTVKLRNTSSDAEEVYRLVGESTGSFDEECIEVTPTSPMGLALMKSRVGETVRVDTRRGEKRYEIVEIV